MSIDRIRDWYETWDGKVAVSYSGGKDSQVLLWLVRKIYPEVPAVFCNTGLEYPEIISMVKSTDNVVVMRPKIPFNKVIETHGYPLVSKKVARGVSVLRNPTGLNQNIVRLYSEGINRFGTPVNGFKVANRWKFLVMAPFKISDKCCEIMKKEPMRRFERETGMVQYVGTLAEDSKSREKIYLQHGCNAYDIKTPRSTPLGFWTEQDVLQCLKTYKIPHASVYGNIEHNHQTGKLYHTGVKRTGCVFCSFGLHMEGSPNRFQMLHDTHPKLWKYCMESLNMEFILKYMKDHCPDRTILRSFNTKPVIEPKQIEMFA
jgi:3'-phosphoadenosine 5'-phosphosulfate sulfotransferase (PAPS reductase)/FAD synthetase